jgi:hypothetical protein
LRMLLTVVSTFTRVGVDRIDAWVIAGFTISSVSAVGLGVSASDQ